MCLCYLSMQYASQDKEVSFKSKENKEWAQVDRKPCSTPSSLRHEGFCLPTLYNSARAWLSVTILNARGLNRIILLWTYTLVSAVYTVTTYTLHPSVSQPNSEYQVALFSFSWSKPLFLWLGNDLEPSTLQDAIKATESNCLFPQVMTFLMPRILKYCHLFTESSSLQCIIFHNFIARKYIPKPVTLRSERSSSS